MKQTAISFIILFTMLFYILLNLGDFMHKTDEPEIVDIIISLGGGMTGDRLKKAVLLYKDGFSKSEILLYTGIDTTHNNFKDFSSRKQYLLSENIKSNQIFHVKMGMITNTMEELFYIRKHMLSNQYKSAIIVSHPEHSRRIKTLASVIANYQEYGLKLLVVSCHTDIWHKNNYYSNKHSILRVLREAIKLVYNLIKYSPMLIVHTDYYEYNKDKEWDKVSRNPANTYKYTLKTTNY